MLIGIILLPLIIVFSFFAVTLALIHQMIPRNPLENTKNTKNIKQIHDSGQV